VVSLVGFTFVSNTHKMKAAGVIIARFQTPFLHEGHQYLLNEIRSRHEHVIVVLGVAPIKGSRRNPFDFVTRERMLHAFCSDLKVLPLHDIASDEAWSSNLDTLLRASFPFEDFVLYGSRDSFIPHYSGHLPTAELPVNGHHNASDIRNEGGERVLATEDFRHGINYAYQHVYPKVYPTVDVALLRDDRSAVLLGRKHQAANWRFPGGFCDPEDDSFEQSAARELREECGDLLTGKMEYITTAKIDDWRYRDEADKIISTFYCTNYEGGEAEGSDDLAAVKWVPIAQLQTMMAAGEIAAEHFVLVNALLKHLGKIHS